MAKQLLWWEMLYLAEEMREKMEKNIEKMGEEMEAALVEEAEYPL